ncbi:MAG: ABC transporter ATP-binding protein [Deltaproteobacteria bacterium]|nr:ABC transporter ATP-binding protein [Deltaproteobacteria bacterium]
MARHVIEVRGLTKTYSPHRAPVRALDRVSFTVDEGQFVTLVGPSGGGKSTLLLILAGLVESTTGEVWVDGEQVRGPGPEKIGIVFQDAPLLPWKTALANVEFPLDLRHVPRGVRRERALALLEMVGLQDFADRYPHELSGGMRQRVAIARGLVQDPRIVLMDEPFGALDEQTRTKMGQELLRIWEKTRKTIFFITHSLTEAIYLSDVVLVMSPRPGRILDVMPVDLPRPRRFEMMGSEAFGQARNRIWKLITEGEG